MLDIVITALASAFLIAGVDAFITPLGVVKAPLALATNAGYLLLLGAVWPVISVTAPAAAFLTLMAIVACERLTTPRVIPRGTRTLIPPMQ